MEASLTVSPSKLMVILTWNGNKNPSVRCQLWGDGQLSKNIYFVASLNFWHLVLSLKSGWCFHLWTQKFSTFNKRGICPHFPTMGEPGTISSLVLISPSLGKLSSLHWAGCFILLKIFRFYHNGHLAPLYPKWAQFLRYSCFVPIFAISCSSPFGMVIHFEPNNFAFQPQRAFATFNPTMGQHGQNSHHCHACPKLSDLLSFYSLWGGSVTSEVSVLDVPPMDFPPFCPQQMGVNGQIFMFLLLCPKVPTFRTLTKFGMVILFRTD